MADTQATINIDGTIPIVLTVVSKATGTPIPGAVISNVQWSQTNEIGAISPSETPNQYIFTPSKAGTTTITATAQVIIP